MLTAIFEILEVLRWTMSYFSHDLHICGKLATAAKFQDTITITEILKILELNVKHNH